MIEKTKMPDCCYNFAIVFDVLRKIGQVAAKSVNAIILLIGRSSNSGEKFAQQRQILWHLIAATVWNSHPEESGVSTSQFENVMQI